jgi:bacteriorhodopsin-like protein
MSSRTINNLSTGIAIVAAIALAAVGVVRGTYAAGGSDSSCYALMARAFASGELQPSSALESHVPWPDASRTFAPGGFVPSQSNPSAAAPVCAPGFSLLLAPVGKVGGPAALFSATPVAGALLVWLAFLAGRALAGPLAGAMSATLVATSPIVLFQVVQPMNDITTAALWMAVYVASLSRRWALAGVCCGLALLVRPNLLPLAIVAGVFVFTDRIPNSESRIRRGVVFCLAALPGAVAVLYLNARLYGGPLRSGYGRLNNLFSLANVPVNAVRYSGWLIETETLLVLLGILAPLVVDRSRRRATWLALGLIGATAAMYCAYRPFDDWSYLRFLLPAITLLLVLASVAATILMLRGGARVGVFVMLFGLVVFGLNGVRMARERFAFGMQALEQRYRSAGVVARDRLPADAAILTTWDSGAIRFHARKEAIVWDALDPAWLDRALEWLSEHGHQPFILVESWEEPGFRERFAAKSAIGNLDWPPKYEVDRVVRIYDPADRARFLRGEKLVTEYLWPLRTR